MRPYGNMHKIFKNIFLFLIFTLTTHAVMAATIEVNDNGDSAVFDTKCNLREAILAANNDIIVDGCSYGLGDDVIIVPDNAILTLKKILGSLLVTSNITIKTKGESATLDGSSMQIFSVTNNSTLALQNLKIINAKSSTPGSVIFSKASGHVINLTNVWLDLNTSTPINLENGTLVITQSTFSNNDAQNLPSTYYPSGGAIAVNKEKSFISNSTFYNNQTYRYAYYQWPIGYGGAIYATTSTLEIYSSTFSENTSVEGGALWTESDKVKIFNTLFVDNAAWFSNDWSTTSDIFSSSDIKNNIFSDSDPSGVCATCKIDSNVTVDTYDKSAGLIPLVTGSSAVDAGNNCVDNTGTPLTYDQRGSDYTRIWGPSCDIGAFELQPISTCGNNTIDGATNEECDDGNKTNEDGCSTTCKKEICGDGILQTSLSEVCDNGTSNSDTTPDACRTTCQKSYCGDNVVDTNEKCDSLKDPTCVPFLCTLTPVLATCGNGKVDFGEFCDNGTSNSNTVADACRTTCIPAYCGDGVVDTGEECDDGILGSALCKSTCTLLTTTGGGDNGSGSGDNGGGNNGSGDKGSGGTPPTEAVCGNGTIEKDEECDDGNIANNDTCSDVCVKIDIIEKDTNSDPTSDSSKGCSAGGILGFLPLLFGAGALKTLPFFRML